MFRNWVAKMFRPRRQFPITRAAKPIKLRTRLLLEALEDRLAPATLVVTNTNDAGAGSLRAEIAAATNGTDTIVFDPSVAGGTINLTTFTNNTANPSTDFGASAFHLSGTENLTIQGSGETLNGNNNFRLFQIDPGVTLNLDSITVQNFEAKGGNGTDGASGVNEPSAGGGGAAGMGGVVFNQGTLNITNSTFTLNTAQGGTGGTGTLVNFIAGGGGVGGSPVAPGINGGGPNGGTFNGGAAFRNGGFGGGGGGANTIPAGNGGFGGGGGAAFDSTGGMGGFGGGGGGSTNGFVAGTGGFGGGNGDLGSGLGNGGGGAGMGGVIFNVGGNQGQTTGTGAGVVTITNSTFTSNSALGGAAGGAGTGFGQGLGGVIFNVDGQVAIMNDTFVNNTVTNGNGAQGNGRTFYSRQQTQTTSATFTNSLINEATAPGGTIEVVNDAATITGSNNILSSNATADFSNLNGGSAGGFNRTGDIQSPTLSALINNGGPTPTIALTGITNPAYDAGTPSGAPPTDQRGGQRESGEVNPDIGAYEATNTYLVTTNQDLPAPSSPPVASPAGNFGTGSLRTAITWANINKNPEFPAAGNVINFAVTAPGVNSPLPNFNSSVSLPITVNGAGVTVTGTGSGSNKFGIFSVNSGTTVTMNGLTVTGGNDVANFGGGINNAGTLTINGMTITGNAATTGGGGIFNSGTLHVDDTVVGTTTISNNTAQIGGGLMNTGTATLGGAGGATTVIISGNTATLTGTMGGVFVGGGGILNEGTLSLTNATLSGNSANLGNGIENYSIGPSAALTINGTTISNNFNVPSPTSGGGGGLFDFTNGGTASITATNATISGNTGTAGGGLAEEALSGSALVTLTNVTIAGNTATTFQGGGLKVFSGTANLLNTIVAGNTGPTDVFGTITSQGHNLIGTGTWTSAAGDITGVANPLLAPLANYGGVTQTMAELPGSQAINGGSNTSVGSNIVPATDQRGVARPQQVIDDIGAFESLGFSGNITSGSPQSTLVNTAFALPLIVTITSLDPNDSVVQGGVVTFTAPSSGPSTTMVTQTASIGAGAEPANQANVSETANGIASPPGTPYPVFPTASGITAAFTGGTAFGASRGFALQNLVATMVSFIGGHQPTNTVENAIITPSVQVTVLDQNGATLANVPVVLTLTTGPGTLTGGGSVNTNGSGVATFSALSINEEGTGDQLTATAGTSPNTATATSALFNITDAALTDTTPQSLNNPIVEGSNTGAITAATFTDANPGNNSGDFTATITWGDGSATSPGTVNYLGGNSYSVTFAAGHTYAEEGGPFNITVVVNDIGGSTVTTGGAGHVFSYLVSDAPLTDTTAGAGLGPYTATEGNSFSNVVATFTDANGSATAADFTSGGGSCVINWGDGTPTSLGTVAKAGTNFQVTGTHTYAEPKVGGYQVHVAVTDDGGQTIASTAAVTVNVIDATLTDATVANNIAAAEGASTGLQVVGTFADNNPFATAADFPSNTAHVSIDWGDLTGPTAGTATLIAGPAGVATFQVTGSHTYTEAGTFPVHVTVTDVHVPAATVVTGGAGHAVNFVVADAPLTDTTNPNTFNTVEGASPGLSNVVVATFTDGNPGNNTADFTSTPPVINWGDGGPTSTGTVNYLGGNSYSVTGSHSYAEENAINRQVSVLITDDDGPTTLNSTGHIQVAVADATLANTTPTANFSATEGSNTGAVTVGTFSDNNPLAIPADFPLANVTIHWGDGGTSQGTVTGPVGGPFTIQGSHTYNEAGTFAVTVNVTDVGGSGVLVSGTTAIVGDAALTDVTATLPALPALTEGAANNNLVVAKFTDNNQFATASDFTTTPPVISWGDFTTSTGTIQFVSAGGGISTWEVLGSHTYTETSSPTYAVSVAVTDTDGSTIAATGPVTVTVNDAPLTDTTVHSSTPVVEGNMIVNAVVGTITDSNPFATPSDFPSDSTHLLIHWGDGNTSVGTIQQIGTSSVFNILGSHAYTDPNTPPVTPYNVTVDVMDEDGQTVTTGTTLPHTTAFVVSDAVLTDATAAATINAVEGNPTGTQLVATFTDNNPLATVADYTAGGGSTVINWGDTTSSTAAAADFVEVSSNATSSTWNVFGSHLYFEKGNFNVSVHVVDDDGNTVTTGQTPGNTVTFAVADAALSDTTSTTGPYNYSVTEGHLLGPVVVATFADNNPFSPVDPNFDFPPANVLIDWGDGTPMTQGTATPTGVVGGQSLWTVTGSHTYADVGTSPYNVVVHITDVDSPGGALITSGTTVTVTDEILTDVTPPNTEFDPVEGNSTGNQVVATFTDNNPQAPITDFQAIPPSIDWGDGSLPTAGTVVLVSRSASVSTWNVIGSHIYSEVGTFNISVSITDVDGMTLVTPATGPQQVVEDVQDAKLTDATPNQTFQAVEGNPVGPIVVAVFNDANPSAPASDFGNGLPTPNLLINWGDGTFSNGSVVQIAPTSFGVSTWEVIGSHPIDLLHPEGGYIDPGVFAVHVHVIDADGAILATTNGTFINVVDAALTDVAVQTSNSACAGMPTGTQVVATFTDNNPFATTADFPSDGLHLKINWGDGSPLDTTTGGAVFIGSTLTNTTFNIVGNHTYAKAGVYNVSVFIMDEDGAILNTPAGGANQITFNVDPNHLVFTTIPSTSVSGKTFTVVVTGYDKLPDVPANISTGYNGPITLSIFNGPPGGHLGGTLTVNAINGVATFSNLTLDRASPPQYFLEATTPCGDTLVAPTGIEVTASAIIVTSSAAPVPGVAFPVTFTAVDVTGNVATNYVGPATLTVTQTPLYGLLSAAMAPTIPGAPNVSRGHGLGSFAFTMGPGPGPGGILVVNLKDNKAGTFTVSWTAPGGFFGSFTWSLGRRLNIFSSKVVSH